MGVKIVFSYENTIQEWVRYAFSILSSSLDCDVEIKRDFNISDNQDTIVVSYSSDIPSYIHGNHLHIFSDPSFSENFGKPESLPSYSMARYSLQDLHLTPNQRLEDPLIFPYMHDNNRSTPVYWKNIGAQGIPILICECDLLASAFFWLTRYEETLIQECDELGRIPEDRLLCIRENCYSRPLVDEYTEVLHQLLNRFGYRIHTKREAFRVLITHDVDSGIPVKGKPEHFENGLRSFYREVVREHRVRAGLTDCLQQFAIGMGWRSYVDSFHGIVQTDKRYGYTSHFFIMANGTHSKDAQYDIYSEYSRNIIRAIESCGGQLGLHLGINSHKCPNQFEKEWSNIREVFPDTLSASRSHFLVLRIPDTWKKLAEVGCRVDTTLGFSKYMGFRAGTSRPFRPFDMVNQRVISVWEYPLILMDKNLFALSVHSDAKRMEQAFQVIDKVAAHGGCLVINWHNVYYFSDYKSMYTAILDYVAKRAEDIRLKDAPEPEQKLIW
jgi:hypothetical protein